jgi:hypothetical protein
VSVSPSLENIFISAAANTLIDMGQGSNTQAVSTHNLYEAYKAFYAPFLIGTGGALANVRKVPLVASNRLDALMAQKPPARLYLQHHTSFGRSIKSIMTDSSLTKTVNGRRMYVFVPEKVKNTLMLKNNAYDSAVRLAQNFPN